MAITTSGLFFLPYASALNGGSALDLSDAAEFSAAFIDNTATPNFLTHDSWADLSADEVAGGAGWPAGGVLLSEAGAGVTSVNPSFEISGTLMAWLMDPIEVEDVTFTGARGLVFYRPTPTTPIADPLLWLTDLQTDREVNGLLRITFSADDGVFWMAREDAL